MPVPSMHSFVLCTFVLFCVLLCERAETARGGKAAGRVECGVSVQASEREAGGIPDFARESVRLRAREESLKVTSGARGGVHCVVTM